MIHPAIENFMKLLETDKASDRSNLKKWCGSLPRTERDYLKPKIESGIAKEELSEILKEMAKPGIKKGDVPTATPKKGVPTVYKKGDVLMHPAFLHPYILLEWNENGYWNCGLLTSEETCAEILEGCRSRFFDGNYFTRVLFTTVEPVGRFMYPFENIRQVNSVCGKLKALFV